MAVVTFDWFRNVSGKNELLGRNAGWFYNYLNTSGIVKNSWSEVQDRISHVGSIFNYINISYNQYGWAYLYDRLEKVPPALDFFLDSCGSDVVIGYELSRAQKRIIDAAGKSYIDIRAHPIRFLTDYQLSASTNNLDIHARIAAIGPSRRYVDMHVNFHKARAARRYTKRLDPSAGFVFFAQTALDSSRIRGGEFVDDAFVLRNLNSYIDEHKPRNFYIKHHPHEKMQPPFLKALVGMGAKEITTETYDLLSVEGLRVCALSSSVLHEAYYFGCEPVGFIEPLELFPPVGGEAEVGDYIMLPANFYDEEVMKYIIYGEDKPVCEYPKPAAPFRAASGLSWG